MVCLCKGLRIPGRFERIVGKETIQKAFCHSRYPLGGDKESKDLPWIQNTTDVFEKDPFLHRTLGVFIFRKTVRQENIKNWNEFSSGISGAIERIASCVSIHDSHDELKYYLGPPLLEQYRESFQQLKDENKEIELIFEKPEALHISGARFITGLVEPGKEHVLSWCGQKRIVSKGDIEQPDKQSSGWGLEFSKKSGLEFSKKYGNKEIERQSMRFQIDIKFKLSESYSIMKKDYSQDFERPLLDVYHRWRFESRIAPPEEELELDWLVVDIDDFMKIHHPLPEDR